MRVRPSAPLLACGCYLPALLRLLMWHRFRVHPVCWPAMLLTLLLSAVQSCLRPLQSMLFSRRVAATRLKGPPVFIIGHWRSGTTFLHYLLTLDKRHIAPNAYECFAPNHFLLTERWMKWLLRFVRPDRRPMDNVLVGIDSPQEDEIGLAMLGAPSPYLSSLMFPGDPVKDSHYFDLQDAKQKDRAAWQQTLFGFYQQITLFHGKRIISKSPLHTARIKWLLELFPDARFVHIVRDPWVVYCSTLHMRRESIKLYSWRTPGFDDLEEAVYRAGLRLFNCLERDKDLIPPSNYCEVRYEDLVKDPVRELRNIYQRLDLGDFSDVQPGVEDYLMRHEGYKINKYNITPELREKITRRWQPMISRYGYHRSGEPAHV